ncbi:putative fungal trichothecene efflux pump (TRI12) [Lyophyllum shimeji]|uniref:Fungal trichothecene efflux pump (TRI12) n=1 Tax=Lyophyllum shimeji TaxID=47721 RepID=A0A9P3UP93_LYOSH|nr:putative fungal trichothecene efflux pump (TRI12) [Lyophyllum shimeji]
MSVQPATTAGAGSHGLSTSGATVATSESPRPRRSESDVVLTDQTNLLPFKQVIAVFSGLALCIIVSTLDSVIVATALPTISTAFRAGSVPLYGRFSDIFGRKAALVLAMSIFMIGNLVAGFARSIVQLIVFRGFAGAGGGGIISMAQIVISDIVSLRDRGKYQGIIGGAVALGYTIGPVIGGALSQKVSWRWCFWIDIPVSFGAMCVVVFVLPLKPVQGDMRRKLLVVDYLGAGLTLLGCALVILPLIWGGVTFPWKSAVVLAPLCSGFIVIVLFCLWEWKGAQLPTVPMYIFKHVTVTGVYITMFINGFVFFSSLYYLPQFFQSNACELDIRRCCEPYGEVSHHYSPRLRDMGDCLWLSVYNHVEVLARPFKRRRSLRKPASQGRKDMSVVTAFRNFVRLLGGTLSLAISSTIINNSLTASMKHIALAPSLIAKIVDDPASLASPSKTGLSRATARYILDNGYTKGFRSVFLLNAGLAAVATVVSILMIKHKELTRGDEEALRMSGDKKQTEDVDTSVPRTHGGSDDVELGTLLQLKS